ncbi:hypothetical protein GGR50DRAFT_606156 [Xylaria sp. CBS 124048]|nr:hypothetical protein GGR50DRAFT_606156 [Xylaria sp. CBS 124048]
MVAHLSPHGKFFFSIFFSVNYGRVSRIVFAKKKERKKEKERERRTKSSNLAAQFFWFESQVLFVSLCYAVLSLGFGFFGFPCRSANIAIAASSFRIIRKKKNFLHTKPIPTPNPRTRPRTSLSYLGINRYLTQLVCFALP